MAASGCITFFLFSSSLFRIYSIFRETFRLAEWSAINFPGGTTVLFDKEESDMPKYSGVTVNVQPVEMRGRVSGYVISGFFTKKQLAELLGRKR